MLSNSSSLPTTNPFPFLTQEEWEQLARELAMSDEEFLEMAANLGKQPDQDLLVQNDQTDVIMSDEQDMDQAEDSDDADDDNAGYEEDGQFRCDEPRCLYRTNRLSNMPRHKRTHLSKEEKLKFKVPCTWEGCELTFYQKSDVKRHVNRVHRKMAPESSMRQTSTPDSSNNSTRIKCEVANCPKTYQLRGYYLRHLREKHNMLV